jgi:hypothetical protein
VWLCCVLRSGDSHSSGSPVPPPPPLTPPPPAPAAAAAAPLSSSSSSPTSATSWTSASWRPHSGTRTASLHAAPRSQTLQRTGASARATVRSSCDAPWAAAAQRRRRMTRWRWHTIGVGTHRQTTRCVRVWVHPGRLPGACAPQGGGGGGGGALQDREQSECTCRPLRLPFPSCAPFCQTTSEWAARTLIERSAAVKCPTVAYHLAGTKKVQQVRQQLRAPLCDMTHCAPISAGAP